MHCFPFGRNLVVKEDAQAFSFLILLKNFMFIPFWILNFVHVKIFLDGMIYGGVMRDCCQSDGRPSGVQRITVFDVSIEKRKEFSEPEI
jgi:hypothetical protein